MAGKDFTYEIIKVHGKIDIGDKWSTVLTTIKWGDRPPCLDLRKWSNDMSKMGKGVSFPIGEAEALIELLKGV